MFYLKSVVNNSTIYVCACDIIMASKQSKQNGKLSFVTTGFGLIDKGRSFCRDFRAYGENGNYLNFQCGCSSILSNSWFNTTYIPPGVEAWTVTTTRRFTEAMILARLTIYIYFSSFRLINSRSIFHPYSVRNLRLGWALDGEICRRRRRMQNQTCLKREKFIMRDRLANLLRIFVTIFFVYWERGISPYL